MQITDKINAYNIDCMEFMRDVPDKFYQLACVDPPYNINADIKNDGGTSESHRKNSKAKINNYKSGWDNKYPTEEYFKELFRISEKQIIWGVNYYPYDFLNGGRLFWNKNVTMPTYSQGEIAYLSWLNKVDYVELTWHGMLQNDMKNKQIRIHPTEKPYSLYRFLLDKYATKGDRILDTHGGSMSIAIACHDYGFDLDICELDKDYFDSAVKRIKNHVAQQKLF